MASYIAPNSVSDKLPCISDDSKCADWLTCDVKSHPSAGLLYLRPMLGRTLSLKASFSVFVGTRRHPSCRIS